MPLNTGVLIIGSLLWDSEKGRPAWRDGRLDAVSTQIVTAPIRYGRLSSGKRRGRTYTMVFSRSAGSGHARVVRCTRQVATTAELLEEATALWKAEQPSAAAGRIAAAWGCVALLCNPNREMPEDILKAWADRVRNEQDYGNVTQTEEEGRLINESGRLLIDWPTVAETGEPVQLDLLLATANDPMLTGTPRSYPSVETIVDAWNVAAQQQAEYFWKNTDSGITTFQDDEIRARLRPRQAGEA